jgi:hypothetical protein
MVSRFSDFSKSLEGKAEIWFKEMSLHKHKGKRHVLEQIVLLQQRTIVPWLTWHVHH